MSRKRECFYEFWKEILRRELRFVSEMDDKLMLK